MNAPTENELIELVCQALRPTGMRERLRLRLSGGYTAKQILHRLPEPIQQALVPPDTHPSQAQTAALSVLEDTLKRLWKQRKISRKTVNIQEQDGRGVRRLQLDVYRL